MAEPTIAEGPRALGEVVEEGSLGGIVTSVVGQAIGHGIGFLAWSGVFSEPINQSEERAEEMGAKGLNDEVEGRKGATDGGAPDEGTVVCVDEIGSEPRAAEKFVAKPTAVEVAVAPVADGTLANNAVVENLVAESTAVHVSVAPPAASSEGGEAAEGEIEIATVAEDTLTIDAAVGDLMTSPRTDDALEIKPAAVARVGAKPPADDGVAIQAEAVDDIEEDGDEGQTLFKRTLTFKPRLLNRSLLAYVILASILVGIGYGSGYISGASRSANIAVLVPIEECTDGVLRKIDIQGRGRGTTKGIFSLESRNPSEDKTTIERCVRISAPKPLGAEVYIGLRYTLIHSPHSEVALEGIAAKTIASKANVRLPASANGHGRGRGDNTTNLSRGGRLQDFAKSRIQRIASWRGDGRETAAAFANGPWAH